VSDFPLVKLSELAEISGGITKNSKRSALPIQRPYLAVANVHANRLDLEQVSTIGVNEGELGRAELKDGDLLVVEGNGSLSQLGRVALWRDEIKGCLHQNHLIKVRPGEQVESKWILYWLMSPAGRRSIEAVGSSTSGLHTLSLSKVSSLPTPLAPKEDQQRAVAYIELHLSRLDETTSTLQAIQAKLKQARASILKAAVEGRLVEMEVAIEEGQSFQGIADILNKRQNLRPMKKTPLLDSDSTQLSHLPPHWAVVTIGTLCDVGTGATPRKGDLKFWKDGCIPWITSSACNQRFADVATDFVTDVALRETNLTLYPPRTLLLAMYGEGKTRGRHTMLRIQATTNQAMAALTTSCLEEPTVRWLRIFLESNYMDMRRKSSGGVQPNLNLSIVKSIALPFPPIAEQSMIADEVERRFSVLDQVEATVNASLRRCGQLRQAVLRRAFGGINAKPCNKCAAQEKSNGKLT
jgi:type I restriction enzyme S subunit